MFLSVAILAQVILATTLLLALLSGPPRGRAPLARRAPAAHSAGAKGGLELQQQQQQQQQLHNSNPQKGTKTERPKNPQKGTPHIWVQTEVGGLPLVTSRGRTG